MSAAWIPGRWRDRLPRVLVVGLSTPGLIRPSWLPFLVLVTPTQHRLRRESRRGPTYSTRVGICWPGVVRTARELDLRGLPPTLPR